MRKSKENMHTDVWCEGLIFESSKFKQMIGFIEKSIFPCIHGVLFLEIIKYYYSKKKEYFC